jgi:hypothetical protein
VTFAHIDPEFAKHQLITMCREWYMHPNGQLPAYEWAFGDVNPPVQAWAALRVFQIDGSKDFDFLERMMHKLLLNFTWWVNRKDEAGNNLFEGGFLGLDNIGPIDRSAQFPSADTWSSPTGLVDGDVLPEHVDIALILAEHDQVYEDLATKFFEHYAYIAAAMANLWDDHDGFYYDVFRSPEGDDGPGARALDRRADLALRNDDARELDARTAPEIRGAASAGSCEQAGVRGRERKRPRHRTARGPPPSSSSTRSRLRRSSPTCSTKRVPLAARASGSQCRHRDHPFVLEIGGSSASVDYEPGESTSGCSAATRTGAVRSGSP